MGKLWLPMLVAFALFAGACSSGDSSDIGAADDVEQEATSNGDESAVAVDEIDDADVEIPVVLGAPLNRFELQLGQCFNEGSWYDENLDRRVDLTASIDCSQDHQSEVYHEAEFPAPNGAPFPGEDKMTEWSTQICYDQFADFIDAEYEVSIYEIGFVQPSKDTFEHPVGRHRRVFCYVFESAGESLAGSAESTGV